MDMLSFRAMGVIKMWYFNSEKKMYVLLVRNFYVTPIVLKYLSYLESKQKKEITNISIQLNVVVEKKRQKEKKIILYQ